MAIVRFYLAPIVQVPPRNAWANKVLLYLDMAAGDSHAAVMPNPYKMWSLAWVSASEMTHVAIQADTAIMLIPFWNTAGEYLPLTAQVSEIATLHRTNLQTYLENHRVPTGWITGSHYIGNVLKYVIRVVQVVQMMKDRYPEYNLSTEVGDIPAQKRNEMRTWMQNNGLDVGWITLSTTVRQVVRYIVINYSWRPVVSFGTALL